MVYSVSFGGAFVLGPLGTVERRVYLRRVRVPPPGVAGVQGGAVGDKSPRVVDGNNWMPSRRFEIKTACARSAGDNDGGSFIAAPGKGTGAPVAVTGFAAILFSYSSNAAPAEIICFACCTGTSTTRPGDRCP